MEIQKEPKPIEPIIVSTVFDDKDGVEKYHGVPVEQLLDKPLENVVWLLWTGKNPTKFEAEIARNILITVADHGPSVAGAFATILATSAGLNLPQAVASGVQMIGPRFGGAAGEAARHFKYAVENNLSPEDFETYMKKNDIATYPGFGHKVFSRTRPDPRVAHLVKLFKAGIREDSSSIRPNSISEDSSPIRVNPSAHIDFALSIEELLLKKNDKLILNIDGTIGAILLDLNFPLEGIDGFFVLGRTIGLIAHYIDQKQRGTGLIRIPEELVLHKATPKNDS